MKKLLLLLTLSFFSIQGFAAGCPDGSEPVKSLSADGTYFVFECGGSSNKIDFQIINLTDFEDSYFTDKADYASSKMTNTITKNLVLIYPLGDFLSVTQNDEMDFLGSVHVSHERIIDDSQIKQTLQTVKKFLANKSCIDARGKNDLLNNIEWVLKNGFYSGLQDPLCRDVRFVMMSVSPEQRKDNNKELLRVFFHEIYHSLQNDLRNNCSGPNDLWVIEAAAEYFAKHSVSIFDNSQQDYVQSIFHWVVQNASRHGFKLEDPGVAEKGLGALRLKIEEGWLDESRILNGSLFHNCARVKEFQDNDPKIQYLKDNWFKIEKHNGAYRFNTSMTKADAVKNLYSNAIEDSFNGVEKGFENDSDNEAKQCNFQAIYEDYRGWANGNNFEESYLYILDNNGNCIDGRASSQNVALKECQRRKAKKLIKNSECKVYAIGDEIFWDGHSKPSKDEDKENASSKKYPTVNYNTKLDEVCRGLINNNWNSYLNINKNEFNSKGYMFVVAGEDGRCESGIGSNKEHALNECTKWQEENNIIGVCELYAEGEEVVWDGHLKPSK